MKPTEDTKYWLNLQPPLCPNDYEVEIFRHHTKGLGPVCLFGMTEKLQPLCDFMVDLNPIAQTKPVIKCDWNNFTGYSEAIIGDGVINLEGIQLVEKLLKNYEKIIFRVFLEKFTWMKYATYFPKEFPGSNLVIPTQENIAIVVWEQ